MTPHKNLHFYKRLVSALVLAPLCIWLVVTGGLFFYGLVGVMAGLAMAEWAAMCRRLEGPEMPGFMIGGVFYICVSSVCLILMPPYLTLSLLVGVWASDTGAYFIGKTIGRRKVFPKISPNKTLEGFIAACMIPAILAILLKFSHGAMFPDLVLSDYQNGCGLKFQDMAGVGVMINPLELLSYGVLFGLFFLVGVFGQAGDLMVSAFKRRIGVKDTGALIPGHGGILDRVDALLFATFGFYIFFVLGQGILWTLPC